MTEFEDMQEQLDTVRELLLHVRTEMVALRHELQEMLKHIPMQQIPSDPDAEVQ